MEQIEAQDIIREAVDLLCTVQCEFTPVLVSSVIGFRGSIVTRIVLFHSRYNMLDFNILYFPVTFKLPKDEVLKIVQKHCQEYMNLFLHDAQMWRWASGSEE